MIEPLTLIRWCLFEDSRCDQDQMWQEKEVWHNGISFLRALPLRMLLLGQMWSGPHDEILSPPQFRLLKSLRCRSWRQGDSATMSATPFLQLDNHMGHQFLSEHICYHTSEHWVPFVVPNGKRAWDVPACRKHIQEPVSHVLKFKSFGEVVDRISSVLHHLSANGEYYSNCRQNSQTAENETRKEAWCCCLGRHTEDTGDHGWACQLRPSVCWGSCLQSEDWKSSAIFPVPSVAGQTQRKKMFLNSLTTIWRCL